MGLIGKVIKGGLIGLVGYGIYKVIQNNEEDKKRRNTPCNFEDDAQQAEFISLAERFSDQVNRLTTNVSGHMVYGAVLSQSGISTWDFKLDFNDYGKVTGEYWCHSDNHDSDIPKRLGDYIKNGLKAYDK